MKRDFLKKTSFNVLLPGLVSSLNDLSSEMIMPVLLMFIIALGGTGFMVRLTSFTMDHEMINLVLRARNITGVLR